MVLNVSLVEACRLAQASTQESFFERPQLIWQQNLLGFRMTTVWESTPSPTSCVAKHLIFETAFQILSKGIQVINSRTDLRRETWFSNAGSPADMTGHTLLPCC